MEIEIQSHGFTVTGALHAHVVKRLEAALAPFKRQVRSVVARLADETGARTGKCKTCRFGASVGDAPEVFAAETRSDLYAAIDRAAEHLAAALDQRLKRRRDVLRLHRCRAIASGTSVDQHRDTKRGADLVLDRNRLTL